MSSGARIEAPEDSRLGRFNCIADAAELERRGLIVAEGRLVVERLLRANALMVEAVLVTDSAEVALRATLAHLPADVVCVVPRAWMQAITGFNLHRGCLALARRPAARSVAELIDAGARRLMVLEGVANPDNIGGLFRTADAFGVQAVVLGPGCGDPLYRKAIRVSCGSSVLLPFAQARDWPATLGLIRRSGIRLIALSPAPHLPALDARACDAGASADVAVMVGAEGAGLSPAALDAADVALRIPIHPRSDSLNVTVAAGIALHLLS